MPTLTFVHSPFVGPSAWTRVARLFNESGSNAITPALAFEATPGRSHYNALAHSTARAVESAQSIVLIVHSGAGSLADAIANACGDCVTATIFVDTVLPHPHRTWMSTLPAPMRRHLGATARDGCLPPWSQWFPSSVIERLIPDSATRTAFAAELPRVPMAFADEMAPAHHTTEPRAYLRLSDAYDAEANMASASGWPVESETLQHLAMISQADRVATALRRLLRRLGIAV